MKRNLMFSKLYRCGALSLAAALSMNAMPVSAAPATIQYSVDRNMFATENEAKTEGRTWQGAYIDPSSIESADGILIAVSNAEPVPADTEKFFAGEAVALPFSNSLDKDCDMLAACILDYNGSGYDLYYEIDMTTGIWYQTLNTKPDRTNTVIHTRTQQIDNAYGDVIIKNADGYADYEHYNAISCAEWELVHPGIDVALDSIGNERYRTYNAERRIINSYINGGTDGLFAEYTLFGPTWLATDERIWNDNKTFPADLDSVKHEERSRVFDDIKHEGYIRSNGKKGDQVTITSYYDMAGGNTLYDTYIDGKDISEYARPFTYTLQTDNEMLPVGYGVYVLYDNNTGIYETVCSNETMVNVPYMECYYDDYNNAKRTWGNGNVARIFASHGTDGQLRSYGDDYTLAYDVPDMLNLTETEYVDVIKTSMWISDKNENATIYRLDERPINLSDKILDAKAETALHKEFESGLDYAVTETLTVPANMNRFMITKLKGNGAIKNNENAVADIVLHDSDENAYATVNEWLSAVTTDKPVYHVVDNNNVYDYTGVDGDVDQNGVFSISDLVVQQRWLLGQDVRYGIASYVAGNMCKDNESNVFDLCLMKRKLISK